MKSLRIIVLLLSSLSLYGMDDDGRPSPIGSPARPASQDISPFASPAGQRAHAELKGTPRSNALTKVLAELGFKPAEESPRSKERAAAGTWMDKNLDCMERARKVVEGFSPGQRRDERKRPCGDHYDDENQTLQNKRRRPVFMMDQKQPSWNAKLAAAQQKQQPQIDISALEKLAQPQPEPQVAVNSPVSTMQQEVAAQERLETRKRANDGDSDSDDDEHTLEQPAQKKPKRDKKPQGLPFREAAGQGQSAMDISDVEIAAAMKIDSDDTDDSDDL